ncbi:MAG: glycine betaine ABC transporter substrate-binding protein [Planctomycetota bacterium]
MIRAACVAALISLLAAPALARPVRASSKDFTESVILGELIAQVLALRGIPAEHQAELGGSPLVFEALRSGEIDAYADYTGTLTGELLRDAAVENLADLRAALAERGIGMTEPLGFNNTYILGVPRELGERLGLRTISDLRGHPELRLGFSPEFIDRGDGWGPLSAAYDLPQTDVLGVEHAFAYEALDSGRIDVVDLYSTDAEIRAYDLIALEDDLGFFPRYDALILYRLDTAREIPGFARALAALSGRIDEAAMIAMNAAVRLEAEEEAVVAARFLESTGLADAGAEADALESVETRAARLARTAREHAVLVGVSLAIAILVAVPLGVLAANRRAVGEVVLAAVGVGQTIPSIALLVLLIPALGLGAPPAIAALALYSLLPIVRNTHAGLVGIDRGMRESADVLGLRPADRLLSIDLPLAMPSIMAGIKTAAVINVGFAALGGFIGAGGFGDTIFRGIRGQRNDLILEGALAAAALALVVQGAFALISRLLIPKGLRLRSR